MFETRKSTWSDPLGHHTGLQSSHSASKPSRLLDKSTRKGKAERKTRVLSEGSCETNDTVRTAKEEEICRNPDILRWCLSTPFKAVRILHSLEQLEHTGPPTDDASGG